MNRYSTFLESSRPTRLARLALKVADGYVSFRYPRQPWPPLKMMYEGPSSRWVYRRNGLAYLDHLKALAGLTPASRIFDIGCGLGRKTWPLVGYLETGEYIGVDPREAAVEWCRRNLSSRDRKLRFRHIDVRNGYYTPNGSHDASAITLPADDDRYDIVMANSVFTHMLPGEIANYLGECSRILASGGRLLCTFFLSPDNPAAVGPIGAPARYAFPYERDGYRVQHDDCDEHVINYRESDIREMCDSVGIRLLDIKWGSWRGNARYLDFQDIVVGEKP
ncbi:MULTISPECIES: class I SAM-dependent methyltransferase [Sphaerimonospora]|uniref:Methyltransferase type 11 domain-containing protein n=2 Tax=Sphaerimonospora TaxID=1792303 RepID=A0A8J3W1F5_9ACTN|nr:class I SAM-dependent methyltransferase [Sphaerimonospora thailandensis]GIH72063.1 hypothetical protein Mth01_43160 [Sphaerimonospora thailandensis]